MRCPFCGYKETKVIDSRETEDFTVVRRRRECPKCKKRFTTYERAELLIMVVKKDKRREPYNREKIIKGIIKACEKRPISYEQIEKIVDNVEKEIREENLREVKTSFIGNKIMKQLKKIDKIAYVRFASVYKDFTDVESFKEAIQDLINKKLNKKHKKKK